MKQTNPKKTKRRLGQWKAPEACLGCERADTIGTAMRPACQEIHGREIHYHTEKWHCSACGAEWLSPAQATVGVCRAVEKFQIQNGMLTGSEMRSKRKRLNWTQEGLADYSGVSIASIKRAESGVHVLSKLHNDAIASTLENAIPIYEVIVDCSDFASSGFSVPSGWHDEDTWSGLDAWSDCFGAQESDLYAADSNTLALAV